MAWANYYSRSKYKNTKKEIDGIVFDSAKEADRYAELKLLEKAGKIKNLQLQVPFILIPTQREPSHYTKRGREIRGKVLERECRYIADFVYEENGEVIVEDTKGFRTKDYKIKKKLMLYKNNIRIREV